MISPEMLRRYTFFSHLDDFYLKTIAMLSCEEHVEKGEIFFEAGQPADTLYFLVEGSAELHYVVGDIHNLHLRKDFYISDINPGEPFGISALIDPFCYTASVMANDSCRILRIEAAGLRKLCDEDSKMAAVFMRNIARIAMARLHDTRIQLAAARS